ncbi:MAG: AAA family ATPase [Alphaproteobacteria bacterium]
MFTVKKLKISGFKSFAHPTELLIEDGVTGIIGPNGCGKSNVFEAIRWVMGESSSKSLRSGSLDDIIFNGTQNIPAKNFAEVIIELDNFTGSIKNFPTNDKKLVVSRLLERGVGSFFKINNKDVRARDVSTLFYDSGSGPRSSSIISQGNIDQIINFKPIDRKIILEDAAGISGLQARRHESELKLQSTEVNLEKIDINLNSLIEQKKSLSRQARQAERYENISKNIKFYQSILIFSEWEEIVKNLNTSNESIFNLKKKLKIFVEESNEQKKMSKLLRNEILNHQQEGNLLSKNLYETENKINNLKNKQDLIKNKKIEIKRFLETIVIDKNNELKKLDLLQKTIASTEIKLSNHSNKINQKAKLNELSIEETDLKRQVKQLEGMFVDEIQLSLGDEFKSDNLKEEKENLNKKNIENTKENEKIENLLKGLYKDLTYDEKKLEELQVEKNNHEKKIESIKKEIHINSKKLQENRELFNKVDIEIENKTKRFTEINTEIKTLNELTGKANLSKDSIVNLLKIKSGYENAIYAALTNELDATLNNSSHKRWVKKNILGLEPINNPLTQYVTAPNELYPILSQIGFINNEKEALSLQKSLRIGQMLVDKNGNVWRWDGFISKDNLQNKKIIDSQLKINELQKQIKIIDLKLSKLKRESKESIENTQKLEKNIKSFNMELESFYKKLDTILPTESSFREKISLSKYNIQKNKEMIKNYKTQNNEILFRLKEIQKIENTLNKNFNNKSTNERESIEKKIHELDKKTEEKRNQINSLKEEVMREELNKTYLVNDLKKSKSDFLESRKRIELLRKREESYFLENKNLDTLPDEIQIEINDAEGVYNSLNEKLIINKDSVNKKSLELESVEQKLVKSENLRENQRNEITKLESTLDVMKSKEKESRNLIYERSSKQPEEIKEDLKDKDLKYKDYDEIKKYLEKLGFQREQMGPVNLRARIEENDIKNLIEELEVEKFDLEEAIQKLRLAINKINHEGKNLLLVAFDKVNKNFQDLFKKLFNGGEAKLELVKSDDPLQTGLEIYARPPGKKLSSITLLSGGEKTLTAISLIFSIFLINPSPICILDEVDAALDDVNIEKFCVILNELKSNTKTKFLIITHNKITMTSIDRVYGVTMAQKGISDIVSVDFEKIDLQKAV